MPKRYSLEYKEYLSRMIVEKGRRMSELAREQEVSPSTLRKWVIAYKDKTGWVEKQAQQQRAQKKAVYKTPTDYEKELKNQAKEIERLSRENQILKKAMHVFTENHE